MKTIILGALISAAASSYAFATPCDDVSSILKAGGVNVTINDPSSTVAFGGALNSTLQANIGDVVTDPTNPNNTATKQVLAALSFNSSHGLNGSSKTLVSVQCKVVQNTANVQLTITDGQYKGSVSPALYLVKKSASANFAGFNY